MSVEAGSVWSKLWVAPAVGAGAALVVGGASLHLDGRMDWEDWPVPVFVGSPDSARSLLQVIATASATLVSLVFTIIAVVVQLARSRYSPRALRPLVRDRPTHLTIGILVGTFTFPLLVLLGLDLPAGDDDEVRSLSVALAFGLAVVTIGTFAVYSNHIVHAVRVQKILDRLGGIARQLADQEVPPSTAGASAVVGPAAGRRGHGGEEELPSAHRSVPVEAASVLADYDADALVDEARRADVVIRLTVGIGGFVRSGGPAAVIHGAGDPAVLEHLSLEPERTLRRDLAYALRLLVDVGTRALSPGDHDPTSAVQALDQIHDLLGRLATRPLPDGHHHDAGGTLRLVVPFPAWDDYVEQALAELRRLGKDVLPVSRRLLELVDDLLAAVPDDRRAPLELQRALLLEQASDSADADADRRTATTPDRGGIGL
jgi:uncharacterized membrane protein